MENNGISAETIQKIYNFVKMRDWSKFHNPKDLAISISLEAAELLEVFQWSGEDLVVPGKKKVMEEELADIFIYCALMSRAIGSDMESIIKEKLSKNAKHYPVDKAYGVSDKYTDLRDGE